MECKVDITLLAATYNRSSDLAEMLDSVLTQDTGGRFSYEIVVVDNNSPDQTRATVLSRIPDSGGRLRYFFEPRQGKSFALDTGLEAARGAIYAIVDDDHIFPQGTVAKIFDAFNLHPEISFAGGKVLPLWKAAPPPWLTPDHWSPLGLCDYGDHELALDGRQQFCLLAGSFRTADIQAVGAYRSDLGVSGELIGGVEDADLCSRLYQAGKKGLYLPDLVIYHKVNPGRLSRRYHRSWHFQHGRQFATMRDPQFEISRGRLIGVPLHLYRQGAAAACAWLLRCLRGDRAGAFSCEARLRFCAGFVRQRATDTLRAKLPR